MCFSVRKRSRIFRRLLFPGAKSISSERSPAVDEGFTFCSTAPVPAFPCPHTVRRRHGCIARSHCGLLQTVTARDRKDSLETSSVCCRQPRGIRCPSWLPPVEDSRHLFHSRR